ncbi:MAG TPA: hypothetical protein VG273_11905 [Bryobacteraceae bacterium]|jgi:hypothetical protein|nr:hypothetical protein [Bryobacteraceae bacterium]
MNGINAALLITVVMTAGIAAGYWLSPDALDTLAKRFRARAGALRASRRAYEVTHEDLMQESR